VLEQPAERGDERVLVHRVDLVERQQTGHGGARHRHAPAGLPNLSPNIIGGRGRAADEVAPTRVRPEMLSVDEVNALPDDEFVARFGPLFQGPPWIAAHVAGTGPFDSLYAMRHAFHSVLFDAPPERQPELIGTYPDIAANVALRHGSRRDQASAGLDRLRPQEYERFGALNEAYRETLGFPFVICVGENTKETMPQVNRSAEIR
jgi:2-oxo-4-hydroxy-4-carboxy-5-ureidoimidazoline decarboxylase